VRLRRRLNTVLLQWVGLLTVIMAAVWLVALPGLRHNLQDDRLLLARSDVMEKLQMHTRSELIRYAVRKGVLSVDDV
jgi:hypothetical protein